MNILRLLAIAFISCTFITAHIQNIQWQHLSTAYGKIPMPWKSLEQTGVLVADLDNDGVNDFVLSCRKVAPALVWYKRTAPPAGTGM